MMEVKRKRGRPRKNAEQQAPKKIEEEKEDNKPNIILLLALSDEEDDKSTIKDSSNIKDSSKNRKDSEIQDNDSDDGNRFTTNDDSASDSDSDMMSNMSGLKVGDINVKSLIDEIKKRDTIIKNLKNKQTQIINGKNTRINYHCVQMADMNTNKVFTPKQTNIKCWWDDHEFDTLPAYIATSLRNGVYYVFGNFCSFECAAKYNSRILRDSDMNTRYALTNSLKMKATGDSTPLRLAPEREILQSKGGIYTIEKFREGNTTITPKMTLPPTIPMVHIIEGDIYK